MTSLRRGMNVEITIRDEDWRKLGTWKYNDLDEKRKANTLRTLDAKGITFKIKKNEDIDWLK